MSSVNISEPLALSLRALGAAGDGWLARLPRLLADLAADWSLTVGAALTGGHTAYVAEAVTHDGTPVVLKVAILPIQRQLAALRLASGDPYVDLIRYDVPRQALLLQRLGWPLADLGWPAARQLDALARTAARGWRPVPADGRLPTWAEAARWHADFTPSAWEDLARPVPERVVDLAVRCAAAREAAFEPARSVLIHGDVHNRNALQARPVPGPPGAALQHIGETAHDFDGASLLPGETAHDLSRPAPPGVAALRLGETAHNLHRPAPSGAGLRLVDPSGLIGEPAHDLGVIQARGVPGRIGALAARPPHQALEMMLRGCWRAARLTGADPEAVWQWAYAELASTGLFLLHLGRREEAGTFLTAAGKLAAATATGKLAAAISKPATATRKPATATGKLAAAAATATNNPAAATGTATSKPAAATATNKPAVGTGTATGGPARVRQRPRRSPPAPAGTPPGRATLLLMVGLPGAGKTTRAKELAAAHRALRLTPDEWMIQLFGEPTAGRKRDILEGRLILVALQALRLGTGVVLDFGLWSRDERSALRSLAARAGAVGRVVYLPVDPDVQRARIAHRQATAPHTTFPMTGADIDTWRTQFQVPDAAELGGADIPAPPPGWPGWPEWAADRWPPLAHGEAEGSTEA